jgi:hypothetical protein
MDSAEYEVIEKLRCQHFSLTERQHEENETLRRGIMNVRMQLFLAKNSSNQGHEIDRAIFSLGMLLT